MGSPSLAALIVALQLVAGPTLLAAQSPAGDGTTTASVDPLGGWTFSATLEGFYEWNFNRPPDRINPLRAYDTRANTFGIQQVIV